MQKKTNLVERLREMIRSGELYPGQKLKNGIELARDFGVAHLTMRRVLRELELSGDITIIHGKGMFVSRNPIKKRKFLVVRSGVANNGDPGHYILPHFLKRCSELEIEVDEADLVFLRHSPVSGTVRQLRDNQYTGILLACNHFTGTEPELQIFSKLNVPVLIPRGESTDAGITGFGVLRSDLRKAWEDGIKYLKSCGMRKVGLILSDENKGQLIRGFSTAEHFELLKKYDFGSDENLVHIISKAQKADLKHSVGQILEKLMELDEPPEAVFCYSDYVALFVYLAAQKMNLKIPEDISVMGFSGYPGGKMLSPPLATVDCDYAAAGIMAAELLCDPDKWHWKPAAERDFIIPHKLKKRASVAVK